MKYILPLTLVLFLVCSSVSAQDGCAVTENTPMTVTADWLKQHIGHNNLVLLHIGDKEGYDAGHIEGASYLSLRDISATPTDDGLSLQFPDTTRLAAAFEKRGISNDTRIILYFGKDWLTPTTRVYFTLDYAGLENNTSILDGGMAAWTAAGNALSKTTVEPEMGKLKITPKSDFVATAEFVNQNLKSERVKLIDARTPVFYDGSNPGGMKRAGHIPSAKNIPFTSIVNDDLMFKDKAELRKLFEAAGVKAYDTVVAYCHIGQQATLTLFAAKLLGYKYLLYDGSFQEWSANEKYGVEDPLAGTRNTTVSVVTPEWLKSHVKDENVKILDVRENVYDYFEGHVENAVHLADAVMRGPKNGYPTQFFEPFLIGHMFGISGIKPDDTVAVYSEGTGVLGATMIAYLLERVGHKKIAFLDGGLSDYLRENAAPKEYPTTGKTQFSVLDNDKIGADLKTVEESVGREGVRFVDARPPDVYRGEKNIWTRNGHIPGAVNIPWTTLVESNNPHKLRPSAELQKIFSDKGVDREDDVIVYCGTGREASLEYMVLKHVLKYPNVRLYEGSWAEYSNYERLKVER